MADLIEALAKKELLAWARETAPLTREEASLAMRIPMTTIAAWESGEALPTLLELKKAASAYKRPLWMFFLPEPPLPAEGPCDFRRSPCIRDQEYSPALAWEIRNARERRAWAIELHRRMASDISSWNIDAKITDDPESVAERVRARLDISLVQQCQWGQPVRSFRKWRTAIENRGVLVAALDGVRRQVRPSEIRGFSIADRPLPIIVLNENDRSDRLLLTLLHALVHVTLGISAVTNEIGNGYAVPPACRTIEAFCCKVVSAILMPEADLRAEPLVVGKTDCSVWGDAEIAALAQRYCVSCEALINRLAMLGIAAPDLESQYRRKHASRHPDDEDEFNKITSVYDPSRIIGKAGHAFVRLVVRAYYSQSLTLSSACGVLGMQAKHFDGLAQLLNAEGIA